MGYTTSVHIVSQKQKDKMEKFLEQEFSSLESLIKRIDDPFWNKVIQDKNWRLYQVDYPPHSDLAYDGTKLSLGYNHSAGTMEISKYYMNSILRWIALKIGREYTFNGRKMKVIHWDEDEKFPIYREDADKYVTEGLPKYKNLYSSTGFTEYKNTQMKLYSESLILKGIKRMLDFLSKQDKINKDLSRVVKEELSRLDEQWKEFIKEN